MLIKSGQPEILRAAQRDETFLRRIHENLSDIIQGLLGIKKWHKLREAIRIFSNLLYHGLTTLSNLQTLGEEYTGIFQTHHSGKALQKKHVQLIMILLSIYGERMATEMLNKIKTHIEHLPEDHALLPHARKILIETVINMKNAIPLIQRLHKAIFYLNGEYYEIPKRLTGTQYMLVRHWMKNRSTLHAFRVLGIVSSLHLALYVFLSGLKKHRSSPRVETVASSDTDEVVAARDKCSLCLNKRQNSSTISCGHMFCWDCIIEWLQERQQCPICRKNVQPSRVVLLQNY